MKRAWWTWATAASCGIFCSPVLLLTGCKRTGEATPSTTMQAPDAATANPRTATHHSPRDTRVRSIDGMTMVYVPAGTFEMGCSDAQIDEIIRACVAIEGDDPRFCRREHYEAAQPVHTVTLDAFWIDQTEVTNAQFAAFLNEEGNQVEEGVRWFERGKYGLMEEVDGKYRPEDGYADHPVIEVSWYGAAAYCAWVGGQLPTEAQWEYAARGPNGSVYPWGDSFDGTLVNFRDASFTFKDYGADPAYNDGHSRWAPVGSYPAGASWCGAYDMVGNVWEWVSDRWDRGYYARSAAHNPLGPEAGDLRIARGGSWYDASYRVRSTERKALTPSSRRMHWIGFRCVVPVKP